MLIKNITLCSAICLLAACSNAVSYHHSERSSIALEARATDPQQPIQGIVGIKTRTVVVTPGINSEMGEDTGESTSVISDFKLTRAPSAGFFGFGSTNIQSAFITGEAAKNAPASSAKALGGLGINDAGDSKVLKRSVVKNIYRILENNKETDKVAQAHFERLNQLKKLLPENYKNKTYYDLSGKASERLLIIKDESNNVPIPQNKGFLEVIYYEQDLLSSSITAIEEMADDRSMKYSADKGVKYADLAIISPEVYAMLQGELKRLKEERTAYINLIGNHNAIDMAASYLVSSL